MGTLKVKGLHTVKAKGGVYRYAWRGGPRLAADFGTPEFLAELAKAHLDRKAADTHKISGLVTTFKSHARWTGPHPKVYSDKTKSNWNRSFDMIVEEFGAVPVRFFDAPNMRPAIIKWRDKFTATPATADRHLEAFSVLLSLGMREGLLMNNLCSGIDRIYSANRAGIIWKPEDLEALKAAASEEVYQAARLASLSGLRTTDLVGLRWNHIKANSLEIPTGKSRGRRITLVPLYGELRTYIESLPKRALTVLTTTEGQPWQSGFKASWQTACKRAAEKLAEAGGDAEAFDQLRFHDLRGTAATKFYAAGFTAREIAQTMAWGEKEIQALIDRYVDKEGLLRARIERLDANAPGTKL
jgi:integrase